MSDNLKAARMFALALEITDLMSDPESPANKAYLEAAGGLSNFDLALSASEQATILSLALAGVLAGAPDLDSAVDLVAKTLKENAMALRNNRR
jgi:hypothetical protein